MSNKMQFVGIFLSVFCYLRAIHTASVEPLGEYEKYAFPDNFVFGVGSSAYQVEGAWNESGKGESIWDYAVHTYPERIIDKSNADIACDSYHKYEEDIQLLKNLGVSFYRFSIAWTRIVPTGYKDSAVNKEGVEHYNKFIDALLAEGITPYVTIYHWDLPQPLLADKGGWLNESIIEDYVYYSKLLFQYYGDRVKHWTTFNEIMQFCERGYSTGVSFLGGAPFIHSPGVGGYRCSHTALLAHGHVYRMYEKEFKPTQNGMVGITIDSTWCDPLKPDSATDLKASEQYMQFSYGRFVHPIYKGDYPPIMRQRIDAFSKEQGFNSSRLPYFTTEQIEMLKGSCDFLGLNHYASNLCVFNDSLPQPSFESDAGVSLLTDPSWESSAAPWFKSFPAGFHKLLVWIKKEYNNPLLFVAENGWANAGVHLNDNDRVRYYRGYLEKVLEAIHNDKCNIFGYATWTLMDNFEWTNGYQLKFGLIYVDFESPNRTRTPRESYRAYQNITKTRRLT